MLAVHLTMAEATPSQSVGTSPDTETTPGTMATASDSDSPDAVLRFWFGEDLKAPFENTYEHNRQLWWGASSKVDEEIRQRFGKYPRQGTTVNDRAMANANTMHSNG